MHVFENKNVSLIVYISNLSINLILMNFMFCFFFLIYESHYPFMCLQGVVKTGPRIWIITSQAWTILNSHYLYPLSLTSCSLKPFLPDGTLAFQLGALNLLFPISTGKLLLFFATLLSHYCYTFIITFIKLHDNYGTSPNCFLSIKGFPRTWAGSYSCQWPFHPVVASTLCGVCNSYFCF